MLAKDTIRHSYQKPPRVKFLWFGIKLLGEQNYSCNLTNMHFAHTHVYKLALATYLPITFHSYFKHVGKRCSSALSLLAFLCFEFVAIEIFDGSKIKG